MSDAATQDPGTVLGAPGEAPEVNEFRGMLPEAYRDDPGFRDFKDLEGLAKSYKAAASLVGIDKNEVLRIPKDPAAPEWRSVYEKLGAPAEPDGYDFSAPAGIDEQTLAGLRAAMHETGVTKAQAARIMDYYNQVATGAAERMQTEAMATRGATFEALKKEWGPALDEKVTLARRAVAQIGGDALRQFLEDSGAGNNPELVRAFARMGEMLGEPAGLHSGGAPAGGRPSTPAAAQAEIRQLMADKAFSAALVSRSDPGHQQARERWDRLHAMAYPQG